jgi:hypothetical protein
LLDTFESRLALQESGQAAGANLTYAGVLETPEVGHPCHHIREVRANGETWLIAIDPQTNLPCLLRGQAADGQLLESYAFLDFKADLPELASTNAFRPETRWAASGGLLDRIIR